MSPAVPDPTAADPAVAGPAAVTGPAGGSAAVGPAAAAGPATGGSAAGGPAGSSGQREAIRARLDEVAGPEPSGAGRALLSRLLRSYATKTPPGIEDLAEAWHAGDTDAVRDRAHALKGSASNLGVTAMSELCAAIEDEARAGRLADPLPALDELRATFAEVAPVCLELAGALDAASDPSIAAAR